MDENKHLENAREDLMHMYCSGCKEFKTECPCGNTYCVFCEFECDCTDGADIEQWETTTPPEVYITDDYDPLHPVSPARAYHDSYVFGDEY